MDNKQNYLRQKGINIDAALNYTGDFETYNEVFNDFIMGLDNQISEIEKYKNASDMANYAILVHALKSNARCLGIDFLADIAYQHELSSKQCDINYINSNYVNIINAVNQVKVLFSEYNTIV